MMKKKTYHIGEKVKRWECEIKAMGLNDFKIKLKEV